MDAREIGEWRAYERCYGPLGNVWRDEVLAEIHELLQTQNRLTGQAHFTDNTHSDSGVPEPEHFSRPYEVFDKAMGIEE